MATRVKRYYGQHMHTDDRGDYVTWADYAKLKAELVNALETADFENVAAPVLSSNNEILEDALEDVENIVFRSEVIQDKDTRHRLRWYMARWRRQLLRLDMEEGT